MKSLMALFLQKDTLACLQSDTTDLLPTKFAPYVDKAAIKQSLILVGGDGSGYDYGESYW